MSEANDITAYEDTTEALVANPFESKAPGCLRESTPGKITNPLLGTYDTTGPRPNLDHALIVKLRIAKFRPAQIAEKVGCSVQTVRNVLRNPEAREQVLEAWEKTGAEKLSAIFEDLASDAVWRTVELAENAESEQVRLQANTALLDRYLGKPGNKVEVTHKDAAKCTDEELRNRLASRLGNGN